MRCSLLFQDVLSLTYVCTPLQTIHANCTPLGLWWTGNSGGQLHRNLFAFCNFCKRNLCEASLSLWMFMCFWRSCELEAPLLQVPWWIWFLHAKVGVGYVIQAPSASVTKRAAGSPKEAIALWDSLLGRFRRQHHRNYCQAFGGLETQVVPWTNQKSVGYYQACALCCALTQAGASYLMQAPCASASSKGKSVESPKEAWPNTPITMII